MSENRDIAAELVHMTKHPAMFTKAEMVEVMKQAAEQLRANKAALAKARAGILEAIGHLDHLPVIKVRWPDEPGRQT